MLMFILFLLNISSANPTIKVGVIDVDFDLKLLNDINICETKSFKPQAQYIKPKTRHGTNVVALINKFTHRKDICFVLIDGLYTAETIASSINYLKSINVKYINISGAGTNYDKREALAVNNYVNSGGVLFVSTGNQGIDLNKECYVYPVCYNKNIKAVTNRDDTSNKLKNAIVSIYNGENQYTYGYYLTGTSQSTAIEFGKYLNGIR